MGLGKTEWEDILIEKGIMKPPPEASRNHHPDIVYDISNAEKDEVDLLFEEDEAFVSEYRSKRFEEVKRQQEGCFGSVEEISRVDFVREVTDASKSHPVLVYLYQSSNYDCQVLGKWLQQEAAPKNPRIKFVQIVSTRCIQDYPDANLPTLILYRNGAVQKQLLRTTSIQASELIEQIYEAEAEHLAKLGQTQ